MRHASLLAIGLIFSLGAYAQDAKAPARKPTSPSAAATQKSTSTQPPNSEPDIDPKELQLLKESYAAASGLDTVSRTILLEKQCAAAEDIKELAKSWCTELFQLAKDQLSAGDFRAHAQSAATRSMSVRYPQTALAMLQEIDTTDAQSDERASVSRTVFERIMHTKAANQSFPELMAVAAHLGETGAYPYFATTTLLYGGSIPHSPEEAASRRYTESQVDNCNQVLQQALTYFKRDSMNLKTDFQFMTLLRSGAFSSCPSGWLMHQASTDFANEVVKVATAAINGDEKIRPHSAKMLYDAAQRVLQDIDPVLAESVAKKVGDVKNLTDNSPIGGTSKTSTTTSWLSDPDALQLANQIGTAENVLNNAPDGTAPHTAEMQSAIREGFSAAQKLIQKVQEIDPDSATALRRCNGPNFPAFLDAAFRIWPEEALDQIEAMPDGEFKAHLLLHAAEAAARNSEEHHQLNRKLR